MKSQEQHAMHSMDRWETCKVPSGPVKAQLKQAKSLQFLKTFWQDIAKLFQCKQRQTAVREVHLTHESDMTVT